MLRELQDLKDSPAATSEEIKSQLAALESSLQKANNEKLIFTTIARIELFDPTWDPPGSC